ncbi:MAG: hypothetical protein GX556_11315 [Fibrobacter sp.]|nr:hypothetical protein [Fibrobacter sp.]
MKKIYGLFSMLLLVVISQNAGAENLFGLKIRLGGRYDNVRKCVASKPGTPGGIAADISAFAEVPAGKGQALHFDLPLMRPILFAAAFHMLQFEPSVTMKFYSEPDNRTSWVFGPVLGLSLHYGPDYKAEGPRSANRFFAAGPIIGAYAGLGRQNKSRPQGFQAGITPYLIPMFGIKDPEKHRGLIVGGSLDGTFFVRPK